jgi:hypothetical protein
MSDPRIAVLQHEPATGPGAFSGLLRESGVRYELLDTNDLQSLPDAAAFTPALDKLVEQLLDGWLDLVTELAPRRARTRLAV